MNLSTITLNKKQQQVYDEVLYGTSQFITLTGAGGTGKSTVTAQIIRDYPYSIGITACTNRAKEVLSNMAKRKSFTTQSYMGYIMVRQGYEESLQRNPKHKPNEASLVIIEEVSMLPLAVYNSLLNAVKEGQIQKLLFLGDPIQLPSIGPGIDINDIPGIHIELTEQNRQSKDDIDLRDYLNNMRTAIENNEILNFTDNIPKSITLTDSHKKFCELYNESDDSKKILAFTNKVVESYNKHINGENFLAGDEVIIDKPLHPCSNGSTVLITDVDERESLYILKVLAQGVEHTIWHWKTKVAKEAYINSNVHNEHEYWQIMDKSYNLKHQYACTVHKSQGSTYKHVFIDGSNIYQQVTKTPSRFNGFSPPMEFNLFLRLMYVAISRMQVSATIFIGDTRNYKKLSKKDK